MFNQTDSNAKHLTPTYSGGVIVSLCEKTVFYVDMFFEPFTSVPIGYEIEVNRDDILLTATPTLKAAKMGLSFSLLPSKNNKNIFSLYAAMTSKRNWTVEEGTEMAVIHAVKTKELVVI